MLARPAAGWPVGRYAATMFAYHCPLLGAAMCEVIFSFDTEDFVTPESDDVLLAIAEMLTRRGVRASFALVGDKVRALWSRGRQDVIEAVARHDVQYHANTHMIWPRTTLDLSRMGWDEGVDLVMRSERHGMEDVEEASGQRPVAWVRCGGNWDPRLLYGLNLLGVRAYVPSQFTLPDGGPLWYVNTLNYRYTLAIEQYYAVPTGHQDLLAEFRRQTRQAVAGVPIVAYAHPCMFTCTAFYDLHNQVAPGVFLPKERWRPAPLLPRDEVGRRLAMLEGLVDAAVADPGVEIVTHGQFIRQRVEGARWLTRAELATVATAMLARFDYRRLGEGYLSAADVFGCLSMALHHYARCGSLPERVPVRRLLGPPDVCEAPAWRFETSVEEIATACAPVEAESASAHRMPPSVEVGGYQVPPACFLMAMAEAVLAAGGGCTEPVAVQPAPTYPLCQESIYREVRVRSSELPDDFEEGTIVTHTHLQAWSARPAVRL